MNDGLMDVWTDDALCPLQNPDDDQRGRRRRGEGEAASVFTFRQMDFIATFAANLPPHCPQFNVAFM